MQELWVRSLGREDPLEEGRQPTLVLLPGESHGQRSLAGYSSWGLKRVVPQQQNQWARKINKFVHPNGWPMCKISLFSGLPSRRVFFLSYRMSCLVLFCQFLFWSTITSALPIFCEVFLMLSKCNCHSAGLSFTHRCELAY